MEERIVKIGIIGLGARAETLLASIFKMQGIAVTAVCDTNPDRIARIESIFDSHQAARHPSKNCGSWSMRPNRPEFPA